MNPIAEQQQLELERTHQPATESTTQTRSKRRGRQPTTNGAKDGAFGWFHYVQDFTGDFAIKWVEDISSAGDLIWDPFVGSGTTALAAKLTNRRCVGYDLNPFMIDVARTKTDGGLNPLQIIVEIQRVVAEYSSGTQDLGPEPEDLVLGNWELYPPEGSPTNSSILLSDSKLQRWISPTVYARASQLQSAVDSIADAAVRRFLRTAIASQLLHVSNMTLRPNIGYAKRPILDAPVLARFTDRAHSMIREYEEVRNAPGPQPSIEIGDARSAGPTDADALFTSPPYPNDMEYVHQTRLELQLLDYVSAPTGLTELKKQMITSSVKLVYRQNEWQKDAGLEFPAVARLHADLAETLEGKNWGWNPANMIAQYFGGMYFVLQNWNNRLRRGAKIACVIGDSAFNGVKVPTDCILAELAAHAGLLVQDVHVLRKRWNGKHTHQLRESVLTMVKESS